MRQGWLLGIAIASAGCSSRKDDAGERKAAPTDEKPAEEKPAEKVVPSTKPTGAPGVAPVASAPRADWPCARTVDSVGARITYDYTGAPAACSFPPDLWQPGCPTRHVQGNPGLGIEIEARYRYDEKHRFVGIDSKLALANIRAVTYEGDKVVGQDDLTYYQVDGKTQIWHRDGSLYGVVDPAPVGIARLRTSLESPDDPNPLSDEVFEYQGSRLTKIRGKALGTVENTELQYDCR